jgi:hypothetical protein
MLRRSFLAILAVLFVGLFAASPTLAGGKGDTKKGGKVDGAITAVDGNNVTIKGKDDSTSAATDDKTKITVDGKPAQVGDLKVGMNAKGMTKDGKTWLYVHAESKK